METPKLIIFDLNKTLIEENSWLDLNMAMGMKLHEDKMLVEWGQEGIIDDALGQRILCSIYQTRGNPTRSNIKTILSNYTYMEGAQATIAELLNRKYRLALISGSMDILAEMVANELNINEYAANNQFVFDKNDRLSEIKTIMNDYDYKLEQMKLICKRNSIELTDCMCVGDGANDVLLFEASNCGVTFENSPVKSSAKYTIDALPDMLKILE